MCPCPLIKHFLKSHNFVAITRGCIKSLFAQCFLYLFENNNCCRAMNKESLCTHIKDDFCVFVQCTCAHWYHRWGCKTQQKWRNWKLWLIATVYTHLCTKFRKLKNGIMDNLFHFQNKNQVMQNSTIWREIRMRTIFARNLQSTLKLTGVAACGTTFSHPPIIPFSLPCRGRFFSAC